MMKRTFAGLAAVMVLGLLAAPPPAAAQSKVVSESIEELQREIGELRQAVAARPAPAPSTQPVVVTLEDAPANPGFFLTGGAGPVYFEPAWISTVEVHWVPVYSSGSPAAVVDYRQAARVVVAGVHAHIVTETVAEVMAKLEASGRRVPAAIPTPTKPSTQPVAKP